MKVAIAANGVGEKLKNAVKAYLVKKGYDMVDLSDADIFTATMNVVEKIKDKSADRGIVVDDYAAASFMIASKNHGIVCAPVYEYYTADMTRRHNSTQMICLGAGITSEKLSCELAQAFLDTEYAGGRHQIRVDMLDRML